MVKTIKKKTVKKAGNASPPAKTKPSVSIGYGYLAQAIKDKSSIDVIQKLMEYEKVLEAERIRREYILAMREFQNNVPVLPKTARGYDKENNREYFYTPLPLIIEKLQPLFYEYGFTYSWDFRDNGEKIEGTIIITHKDGHSERRSMTVEKDESKDLNNIQSVGSARTYLQRYTIIAGFGLTTVEMDDDGGSTKKKVETIPGPESISKEREELERMAINELVLLVDPDWLEKTLLEKYPDVKKPKDYSEKQQSEIRKVVIDQIVSPK